MTRRTKWTLLWILIPMIAMGIFFFLSLNYLINPAFYRNIIQKSLALGLEREVTIGKAEISVWEGLGVSLSDLRIRDRSREFDILQAKKVILKASIISLLRREVKWKEMVLYQPSVRIVRDKEGRFNFSGASGSPAEMGASQKKLTEALTTFFGGFLTLRDGEIFFSDERLEGLPLITRIGSFTLHLSEMTFHRPFPFQLSGRIDPSRTEGSFSIVGTIQNIPENMDLSKGRIKARVDLKGMDVSHFWPYLRKVLPMNKISAVVDLQGRFQGGFSGGFQASVKAKFRELVYDHPQVFAYVLTPGRVNVDLEANYTRKDFNVSRFSVELPDITVKGKGKIYGIGTDEMGMDAEGQSNLFDLSDAKKYIPYRIITRDVSDHLFHSEGSGPVQILSVRLSGKMKEIDHCDQLQNSHVLSVQMMMGKARLRPPWNLPVLEDLRSNLFFQNGNLSLKAVEGRFFHSTIDRADGTIDRLLLTPTLQVNGKGRLDMTDIPALAKTGGLTQSLSSVTFLGGQADYQISVKGELSPLLHLRHQGTYLLSKVRFIHSQIPSPVSIGDGRVDLTDERIQWSGARVEFGHSAFLFHGSWKGNERGALEMAGKGRFDLKDVSSLLQSALFPNDIRLKAREFENISGPAELSFKGRTSRDLPSFSYEGDLIPRGVRLLPAGGSSPIVFREGILSFSNAGLSLSRMKVQSRNSLLVLDGTIKESFLNLSSAGTIELRQLHALLREPFFPDQVRSEMSKFQNPGGEAEVRLTWSGKVDEWVSSLKEGEIRMRDVSFQYETVPASFSQVEGSLLISPKEFRLEGMKGKLGDSPFLISGAVSRSSFPEEKSPGGTARTAVFEIDSPQFNVDSLLPKREGPGPRASFEKIRDWLTSWKLDGKVNVGVGSYRGFFFQDLKVGMKTIEGRLILHPLQIKAAGGDLWGEGWIQPAERGIRFEMKPRLSNIEIETFLRLLLGMGKEERVELTGRVHVSKVALLGEGEDFQRIKESLHGSLRLEVENGVIKRFNILSKIFSILNVSQLFKGRFPDLKTRGLPFHQIEAAIDVNNGVVSTEDFLVNSDAMRITLLGKVDLGKNRIDAKIGVHPLVTLDAVLSNVPVAGYILTGKDKAFLSYVYEVKGDLDDPKIEAIPIKSAGEGLFGIIKRLLETPLRPFQKAPPSK